MGAWVGSRSPGDIESGDGVLNEIDHALAAIGTAHWTENSRTDAYRRYRRQSTSIKWQRWGTKSGPAAKAERRLWVPKRSRCCRQLGRANFWVRHSAMYNARCRATRRGRLSPSRPDLTAAPSAD